MAETRTIDNLGLEPSVRWAQDQEYLDETILRESPTISRQIQIDVSSPFFVSEFDALFETKERHRHWASFLPPKGFNEQKMRLFTFQVIPSLGSYELQQTKKEKIQQHMKTRKKKREEKEREDEEKESETLLDLLSYLATSDRLIEEINSRRSQYSKG